MPTPLDLQVVIVNYRTPQLVVDCLASLADERDRLSARDERAAEVTVWLVDNDSGDDSAECFARWLADNDAGDWLRLRPLGENGGFAAGNNAALKEILDIEPAPDYVLLLNPDTVVRRDAFAALIDYMEAHPDVGLAGSRLEDPDGTPQRSAFRFPSVWSELESALQLGFVSKLLSRYLVAPPVVDDAIETGWVAGASLIVRREVFDATGLLDDEYFMYFEEVDFCLAAKRAGWPCHYVPASHVVHLVGQASGVTTPKQQKRRPTYWFNSRRRYFGKNHGWLYTALTDLVWAVGFITWRIRRRLQRKPDNDPPHFLSDFVRNSIWIKRA